MKYKMFSTLAIALFVLSACKKIQCISCIAQNKNTGIIIDTRAQCNDGKFVSGYVAGFKERYKSQSDSIIVICSY